MTDSSAASDSGSTPPMAAQGHLPERGPTSLPAKAAPAVAPEPLDFAKTLQTYEARLLRYAARLLGPTANRAQPGKGPGDPQSADLVQEAYLRLHRHCREHGASSIHHPGTWLYRVVHNLAIDAIRKRVRQRGAQPALENAARRRATEATQSDAAALGQLEQREQIELALRLLDDLPQRQQQIITLKLLEGLTLREIAEVLDTSPGSVNYHLNQGLTRLAQQLRQKGAV